MEELEEISSRKGKMIGFYKICGSDSVFKILRYKKDDKEIFWLYVGDCLCHARDHRSQKMKKSFEDYYFHW